MAAEQKLNADKSVINMNEVSVDKKDKTSKKRMTQKQQNEFIIKQLGSIKSKQRHLQKRVDELLYLMRKLSDAHYDHKIPTDHEPLQVEDNNNNGNYSVPIGDKSYVACGGGFAVSYEENADSKDISSAEDDYSASYSYPSEYESKQHDDDESIQSPSPTKSSTKATSLMDMIQQQTNHILHQHNHIHNPINLETHHTQNMIRIIKYFIIL